MCRNFFPSASIHSFEISKNTFKTLKKNSLNKLNCLNNFGLSDKNQTIIFKNYKKYSAVNTILLQTDFHDKKFDHSLEKTTVKTGDLYCKKFNIKNILFLKIDTEGSEFKVLKGFKKMIKKKKIRIIQFEYGYANGDNKTLMRDFYSFLSSHGYIIGRLLHGPIIFSRFEYKFNDFKSGPNFVAIADDDIELMNILAN